MRINPKPAVCLNKEKAEQMCQQKLREVSKVKSKLLQSVLVRNTLKYVQNSEYVTFASDDGLEDDEYEPFNKKSFRDISSDDIDNILSDISFHCESSQKEVLNFDRKESVSSRNKPHSIEVCDDSVVPDNEVLEYPSDDDDLDELLRNRTNCTVTRYTKDNRQLGHNCIWH